VAAIAPVKSFEEGRFITTLTRHGQIKKTSVVDYQNYRTTGIIGVKIADDDQLLTATVTDGTRDFLIATKNGKSIRFHESDVRPSGRVTMGVRGMKIAKDDRIIGMEVLSHGQTLFAVTENGFGKRTSIDEYPVQRRGGKGVICIKTTKRNGKIVSLLLVDEEDDLMLMTNIGKVIRMQIKGISVISRNTQGVKLIGVEADERVVGAARLAEKDD